MMGQGPPPCDRDAALRERVLTERTALLAQRRQVALAPAPSTRLLACGSGREVLGIPLAMIAEVLPARRWVPVPGVVAPMLGATGLRGRLWSVVDLGAALGLATMPALDDTSGYFLRLRDQQRPVLLRVERVIGAVDVGTAETTPLAEDIRRGAVTAQALAPAGSLGAAPVLLAIIDPGLVLGPLLQPPPAGA